MARRKLIAGNWKMNPGSLDEAVALAAAVAAGASSVAEAVDLLVIPPAPFLGAAKQALGGGRVWLGGQNLSTEVKGAFTGEVSGAMLRSVGVSHVLCGHSERRQLFGESSELVGKKVRAALRDGLVPVLCVGETLA
ncbi:MAG TPA: triose-phosphate isomerase, partial [Myxococcota bacterium]|nr:triose-phosphate isomerase [Myxococcota bacterium]